MTEQSNYDSRTWIEPTAAGTGDTRENDPNSAGFTTEDDRLYRSHFEHANRLADRSYEQVRAAYQLGQIAAMSTTSPSTFDQIEKELKNGWLNVRVCNSDWASVRDFVRVGFNRVRQPRVP
jgi:hypothetical protein